MRAIVVYESLWGNTAAIARAVADGIGPTARAIPTREATPEAVENADLVVAGAPLVGFRLPTDGMLRSIASTEQHAPFPPDLSGPSMRSWLAALGSGHGRAASFETRMRWSPGSAAKAIQSSLERSGYTAIDRPQAFLVTGRYGPLRAGEIERARAWGADLAAKIA